MPKSEEKTFEGFKVNNFASKPLTTKGFDLSNGKREHFHLERKGEGVEIVSDGFVDEDALIQSEAKNAGLVNILRLQELRYGTIANAIKRNEDKQTYANVANVPTTVGEQAEYIKNIQDDVDALAAKLGISKEDLLKSTQESLAQLLAAKQAGAPETPATGGNE